MEGGGRTGINFAAPHSWVDNLKALGFTEIHVKWHNWPLGPWAKHQKNKVIGTWALADFLDGVGALNAIFTRVLGWEQAKVESFIEEVREELRAQTMPCYQPICFCYARKPLLEKE